MSNKYKMTERIRTLRLEAQSELNSYLELQWGKIYNQNLIQI